MLRRAPGTCKLLDDVQRKLVSELKKALRLQLLCGLMVQHIQEEMPLLKGSLVKRDSSAALSHAFDKLVEF